MNAMEDRRFDNGAQYGRFFCIDFHVNDVRVIFRGTTEYITRIFVDRYTRRFRYANALSLFHDVQRRLRSIHVISSKFRGMYTYLIRVRFRSFYGDLNLFFNKRTNCMDVTSEVFLDRAPIIFLALYVNRFQRINFFDQ